MLKIGEKEFEVYEATNACRARGSTDRVDFKFDILRAAFDTYDEAVAEAVRILKNEKAGPERGLLQGERKLIAVMQWGRMIWISDRHPVKGCVFT